MGVMFCVKYLMYCLHCILVSRILYFKIIVFSSCPCCSFYEASIILYYIASVVGWLMSDELERTRKEVVVAYSRPFFQYLRQSGLVL